MRLLLAVAALLSSVACAQGVTRDLVTPDDLLKLFDDTAAIEVDVPEGATTMTLSYGPVGGYYGLSSFLDQSPFGLPTSLRVVILLPDPSAVDPCAADEAEAVIVAIPQSDSGGHGRHRQKVCLPHPQKSRITGSFFQVIEGETPILGEWTPLLFGAWLVDENPGSEGLVDSAVALDKNFMVQVYFGTRGSTSFPPSDEPELGIDEFVNYPGVAKLVEEYGVSTTP